MIKLICFLKRRPGTSAGDFHEHWLTVHGPLVRDTRDFARHIVRYEQNHRIDADYARDDGAGFDGVAVQWFRRLQDFYALAREPAYREVISADEERFLDRSGLEFVLTGEAEIVMDRSRSDRMAGAKLLCLLERRSGLDRASFAAHWRNRHGPLLRDTPELARHLVGYEQNFRLEADYEQRVAGADGVAEAWFASPEEFGAFASEPAYWERVVPDEAAFVNRETLRFVLARPAETVFG